MDMDKMLDGAKDLAENIGDKVQDTIGHIPDDKIDSVVDFLESKLPDSYDEKIESIAEATKNLDD